jgi:hypothetical protein
MITSLPSRSCQAVRHSRSYADQLGRSNNRAVGADRVSGIGKGTMTRVCFHTPTPAATLAYSKLSAKTTMYVCFRLCRFDQQAMPQET